MTVVLGSRRVQTGKLRCIETNDAEWDALVKSCCAWHPFYLSAFVRAEADFNNAHGRLLVYETDEGCSIYPVVELPWQSEGETTYDLRGQLYAGPISTAEEPVLHKKLVSGLRSAMRVEASDRGWVTDFCRLNPFSSAVTLWEGSEMSESEHVYIDLTPGFERIWNEFKSEIRTQIRHARKSGVGIRCLKDEKELSVFASLYEKRMRDCGASGRYRYDKNYFQSLRHGLGEHIWFTGAIVDEQLVGGALQVFGNGYAFSFLSATDPDYYRFRVAGGLMEGKIRKMIEEDNRWLVLGGSVEGAEGAMAFKKAFSSKRITASFARTVFDRSRFARLCSRTGADEQNGKFFPPYRRQAFGSRKETCSTERPVEGMP